MNSLWMKLILCFQPIALVPLLSPEEKSHVSKMSHTQIEIIGDLWLWSQM